MARGRTTRMLVTAVDTAGPEPKVRRRPDELIVEEPMAIQLDGTRVATTMRTPGNDYELAVGFCFSDGLLDDLTQPVGVSGAQPFHRPTGVRYCADGSAMASEFNVVTVETGGRAAEPTPRLGNVSSSCGWCGSDQLDELCTRLAPLPETPALPLDVIVTIPEAVRSHQQLFDATGGVHGAALFDRSGDVLLVREDVGRHNAVDKLIGAVLLASADATDVALPMTGLGMFVSGRASIEMVQKAWAAGVSALVSVSAPTALAVDAARRAGLLLAGFTRDGRCNVYAPERISGPADASPGQRP